MKLTETNLVELGFTLVDISAEESGHKPFHYYVMDLSNENKNFCLISCAHDELEDGDWWVEFLDTEIRFYHFEHLQNLIHSINVAKEFIEKEKKYSPKKNGSNKDKED